MKTLKAIYTENDAATLTGLTIVALIIIPLLSFVLVNMGTATYNF